MYIPNYCYKWLERQLYDLGQNCMVWSENCMVRDEIVWFQISNLMVWARSGVGKSVLMILWLWNLRCASGTPAESPVKFQSDQTILNSNLMASRLARSCDNRPLSQYWNGPQFLYLILTFLLFTATHCSPRQLLPTPADPWTYQTVPDFSPCIAPCWMVTHPRGWACDQLWLNICLGPSCPW